jgi:condensin complex subunit 1
LRQLALLEAENAKEGKKTNSKTKKNKGRKKISKDPNSDEDMNDANPTSIETELGLDPNNLEDHELDETFEEKERQILGPDSVYIRYAPLILDVCRDYYGKVHKDVTLRIHAINALCKYMTVNLDFCEANLQLLFTLLLNEKVAKINLIVTVGDLACRFPNSVEPWCHHLYRCLRDTDHKVRKQTLMVLCHLVLNDMMKVKSNISEIVRLIEDYDKEISTLAKAFFTELARKGSGNNNPIYNLLPDVLSRLSAEQISQESFRNIMKFMLSFITKDRHNEKLVEKLCQRFKAISIDCFSQPITDPLATQANDNIEPTIYKEPDVNLLTRSNPISQWRDIAYCLTLLPSFNEKCVKKLIDCLKEYQHALADEEVFKTLHSLGTKKFATNEKAKSGSDNLKQAIEDWEKKITELHAKLSNEYHYEQHVVEATSKKRLRGGRQQKEKVTKTPRARRARKRTQEINEENEIEFEDDNGSGKEQKSVKRTRDAKRVRLSDKNEDNKPLDNKDKNLGDSHIETEQLEEEIPSTPATIRGECK